MVTSIDFQDTQQSTSLSNSNNNTSNVTRPDFKPFGEDGLTFMDLIDIINPFQHIPVLSSFYRKVTGDSIDPASRIAGGTLFFGPIGAAAALINTVVEHETGSDLGEHTMAILNPRSNEKTTEKSQSTDLAFSAKDKNPPILDQNNPVTTWAMGELAWARQQAKVNQEISSNSTGLTTINTSDGLPVTKNFAPKHEVSYLSEENTPNIQGDFFSIQVPSNARYYAAAATLYSKPSVLDIVN